MQKEDVGEQETGRQHSLESTSAARHTLTTNGVQRDASSSFNSGSSTHQLIC